MLCLIGGLVVLTDIFFREDENDEFKWFVVLTGVNKERPEILPFAAFTVDL